MTDPFSGISRGGNPAVGGRGESRAPPGSGREERAGPSAARRGDQVLRIVLPLAVLAVSLGIWEFVVWFLGVEPYIVPAPSLILREDPH